MAKMAKMTENGGFPPFSVKKYILYYYGRKTSVFHPSVAKVGKMAKSGLWPLFAVFGTFANLMGHYCPFLTKMPKMTKMTKMSSFSSICPWEILPFPTSEMSLFPVWLI